MLRRDELAGEDEHAGALRDRRAVALDGRGERLGGAGEADEVVRGEVEPGGVAGVDGHAGAGEHRGERGAVRARRR